MSGWENPLIWGVALAILAVWKLYDMLRPARDFYVLQRKTYNQLFEDPWRGTLFGEYYDGFDDFHAAKAAFDLHESWLGPGDRTDGENYLYSVTAASKSKAIARLKSNKNYYSVLLHKTPDSDTLKRRAYWKEQAMAYLDTREG